MSAALQPFANEPLVWDGGKTLVRLRREGEDPTTSRRVLAVEQTLGAAAAIRQAFAGADVVVTLACDVEPADAKPDTHEYWARRHRLEHLLEASPGQTLCRREMIAARPRALELIGAHLDRDGGIAPLRLVSGPATTLTWESGRSVVPYTEPPPRDPHSFDLVRRDVAAVASPTAQTRLVLVLAEAWVGKSYVAQQLAKALRDRQIAVWFTSFESPAPDWPDDEFFRETTPRVWIVDAADEAERRAVSVTKLRPSAGARALTTLVFTRPDATLPDVERVLGFTDDARPADVAERQKFRLLPLDDDQIRRELADLGASKLDELLAVAKRLDAPLTYAELRELARDPTRDLGALRDAVARHRCTTWRAGRPAHATNDDRMLEAARFLAAVAALANERAFNFGEPMAAGFSVNSVIPEEFLSSAHLLRDTPGLVRVGDSYRFAATHLEEDLAAGFLARAIKKEIRPLSVSALRGLLTDGQEPRPELARIVERAREALTDTERKALEQALRPFEPGEALRRFRKVVEETRQGPPTSVWVPTFAQLKWLDAPPVRDEVRKLLSEAGEPSSVRGLALELAFVNGWVDLAPLATTIALSDGEVPRVRQLALELAAGDPRQLDGLVEIFARVPRDTQDEGLAGLRAGLVQHLLKAQRLSPLEAARKCPPAAPHMFDRRSQAIADVGASLDGQAARAILDELDTSRGPAIPSTIDEAVRSDLGDGAVALFLVGALHPTGQDVDRLVYVLRSQSLERDSFREREKIQSAGDDVRRAVYRRLDLEGEPSYLFLPDRDAEWLIGYAGSMSSLPENVGTDLFSSVRALENQDRSSHAERGREILRREGTWDKLEAKLASAREWEARRPQWDEARARRVEEARKTALPIERVVDTILGDRRDVSVRLHALGDLFFGRRARGANVVGTFEDDLSEGQQRSIMEATWDALDQATPLPIPEGNAFPSGLLDEGHAFLAAALWKPDHLDAGLIARWLPAALFVATTDSGSRVEELIERCFVVAPDETRRAVLEGIAREARGGHVNTHRVPGVLWRDARFLSGLISGVRALADAKAHRALGHLLFDVLGAIDTSSATPEVRALLDDLAQSTDDAIRREAIAAWFYRWPEESVEQALKAIERVEDAAAILSPYASWAPRHESRSKRRDMPAQVAGRIVSRLLSLVPVTSRFVGGRVGPIPDVDALAEWRDRLVQWCIEHRAEPELADAIAEIRRREPYAGWLSTSERDQRIGLALEAPPRPWPAPSQVAKIIEGTLALVRDAADLALLVAEIIALPWDPSLSTLLYEQSGSEGPRHGREDRLQVLLKSKLEEGLRKVQPPVQTKLVREPNERTSDEPDFVVFTISPPLEVPIEVKWADNTGLIAGIRDQLGERYLREAGRTHGVFVVGWTGEPPDCAVLQGKLEAARSEEAAKGLTIHIVCKDVSHPSVRPGTRGRMPNPSRPAR